MKKIYAMLFAAVTFIATANAQFQKGGVLLGGSIGFNYGETNTTNASNNQENTSFSVSPGIGFFTKTNRLTGFSLNYGYNNTTSNNVFKTRSNHYGADVYRQYWSSLGKEFYFIIEGRAGLNYNHTKSEGNGSINTATAKRTGADFSINPGFAYRVKKRLVLDFYYSNFLSTYYSHTKTTNTAGTTISQSTADNIGFNTGLRGFSLNNFVFGFRYILK